MSAKVCIQCLEDKKGQIYFKTQNNNVFKCLYHNNNLNKNDYLPITKEEINNLKNEYNCYFEKVNLPLLK